MGREAEAEREPARAQTWTASNYARNARYVSDLGAEILGWLAPQPSERILDLGCGDGHLTLKIAEASASVVGIDISTDMNAGARSRGIDARIMDGERLTFEGEFDAIFSNAALHWMLRSEDVIAGIARALRPGGRFVAEFGGYGNVATIVTALRELAKRHAADPELAGPWFFSTAEDYAAMLEDTGFSVTRAGLYPRPTFLPSGMAGWLQTFAKPFIDQFDAAKRPEVIAQAEALVRPSLCDGKGRWTADYIRLRITAQWPA